MTYRTNAAPSVPKPLSKKASLDIITHAIMPIVVGIWVILPLIVGFATWNPAIGFFVFIVWFLLFYSVELR